MAFANSTTATTDISSVIASYSVTTNFDCFVIINFKCSHFSFNHDRYHALY